MNNNDIQQSHQLLEQYSQERYKKIEHSHAEATNHVVKVYARYAEQLETQQDDVNIDY